MACPFADPSILSSTLALTYCVPTNGCNITESDAAVAAANVTSSGRVTLLSAHYGPFVVTDAIQHLLDTGVRLIALTILPPVNVGLHPSSYVWMPDLGAPGNPINKRVYPLVVELIERPRDGSPPFFRDVVCVDVSSCLLYVVDWM
jgi:hypothetical protein